MSTYQQKLNTAKLFVKLIEETSGEEKKNEIKKCLDKGANVNEQFVNDFNNTPLHVSVINGDLEIVYLLLQHGADLNYKNIEDKTALDIAKELDADVGPAIVELLEAFEAERRLNVDEAESNITTDVLSIVKHEEDNPQLVYQKHAGTSGIKGQLYESKLLTLVLIRASLNKTFDQFHLGTSMDGIGALDDLCIRYKQDVTEGVVFLQAKHRSDVKKGQITLQDLWRDEGDFSLKKYYISYSAIRSRFWVSNEDDLFFKGKYEDLKCTLVIYTTAESDLKDKMLIDVDSIDKTARDLICSGDYNDIYRYKYNENDISLLTNMVILERMKYVGKMLAFFITKGKYDMLMNDIHMKTYHVILSRTVISVSDMTPGGYRIGTFRKDFFNNHDAKLLTLKLVIYKEIVLAKKPNEAKVKELIDAVINDPSKETLSKLMQNALMQFDEKRGLMIQDDRFKDVTIKSFRINVNYKMVCNAFDIAVYETFGKISFKLPSTFGNIDIAVANGKKGEKRLEYLAEKIEQLLDCTRSETVNIDPGLIDLNGGLGSAVGNLFILDEQMEHLILNTDEKTLGKNAKILLEKLRSKIKNLDLLKLNPGMIGFPNLTLDGGIIEEYKTRTFFDHLWFYTCQSKEEEIEDHAKEAIQDYCIANKQEHNPTVSNARYDAIYFIIHDAVQKWWMADGKSHYLTNNKKYFDTLFKQFSGKSLLNVISCMFINTMKKYDIKFNKDSLDYLISQVGPEATILVTGVSVLTGIKLAQCFRNLNNYAFIDLNNVMYLSKNDYATIIKELKSVKLKALIILYEDITEAKNKVFFRLTEKSITNNYILVTNEKSAEILQSYTATGTFVTITDVRNNLNDLELISQEKVLDNTFIFQGVLTKFSTIITNEMKNLITSKILQDIINNETMNIGKTLSNPYYEDIKHYYVQRSLRQQNSATREGSTQSFPLFRMSHNEELIKINTLKALNDTVVIVGGPGMGKSTFLTYLSLETKQQTPSIWIERVNLLDQTKELYRLQEKEININKLDALKFVCKAALSRNLIRFSIKPTAIVKFDLAIDHGEVVLKNCDEIDSLVLFELEMFIHCYNQGNTILLFDGFDEICPHYKKEMTDILKCLVTRHSPDTGSSVCQRMWITGRSYNDVIETLETEFGVSYNLETFTEVEQGEYMKKYLSINMNLNELETEQFKRIDGFFEFMKQFVDDQSNLIRKKILKITNLFLYSLYKTAMKYFYVEINKPQTPDKKVFCGKWSTIFNSKSSLYIYADNLKSSLSNITNINISKIENAKSMIFTPLHVFIVLDYFQNQIKNVKSTLNEDFNIKWDLDMNTSSFYEHFIETKMKKIRFEEKNQMDLYNPDIIMTYEKELKEFMDKHKKLAFYATFRDDLNKVLTEADIEEIRKIIVEMEGGREKTGIVDCILSDGTPKFVHLSFQDYLAVEYISDLLKTRQNDQLKLWRSVFSKIRDGMFDFLDRKLEFDYELMNVITDSDVKQAIFDDIIQRSKDIQSDNIFKCGLNLSSKYILQMLLKSMADVVNDANVDEFIAFLNNLGVFCRAVIFGWDKILIVMFDCVRRVDPDTLLKCDVGVLLTRSYKDCSSREIIRDIKWKMLKSRVLNDNQNGSRQRRNTL